MESVHRLSGRMTLRSSHSAEQVLCTRSWPTGTTQPRGCKVQQQLLHSWFPSLFSTIWITVRLHPVALGAAEERSWRTKVIWPRIPWETTLLVARPHSESCGIRLGGAGAWRVAWLTSRLAIRLCCRGRRPTEPLLSGQWDRGAPVYACCPGSKFEHLRHVFHLLTRYYH